MALGSVWALVPAAVIVGLTVLRTVLEDRTLRAELPGYGQYAALFAKAPEPAATAVR